MSINSYDTKIEIFIPADHVIRMRDELSKVGVGHIGNYDHCVAVTDVRGYFRPLEGADPFEGRVGVLSEVNECKIEVSCERRKVADALDVIRKFHPYEEPLVNIIPLANDNYLQ
jgi:hypothetical protein